MRFSIVSVLALAASVQAMPAVSPRSETGCRVALKATLAKPQKAAEDILLYSMSKWTKSTGTSDFSSNYMDTKNTTAAPYSIVFKANMIPGYETDAEIRAVLDTWVGTYIIGGETAQNNWEVTGVACS
ncbi:Uu.00g122530.m01.CDS01 [Anthostomella pinea]|uniref:Uu.00g122530.m01.CDS01 n=1 Tax=Anthostomella pinea TaxID=933095 RepID=A0AAI8YHE5_9PEZI|nr:Uu.00g122530.m01.CDS01 [Anthostomella pinea]